MSSAKRNCGAGSCRSNTPIEKYEGDSGNGQIYIVYLCQGHVDSSILAGWTFKKLKDCE